MSLRASITRLSNPLRIICQSHRRMSSDGWGSGAGKGGGSGGKIRDAGGSFGKMEAAQEEQYFRKLTAQQLKKLHEHHQEEIHELQEQIEEHEEAIARHKKQLKELNDLTNPKE